LIASMLMPSRERYELAVESIKSLGEGDYEVLIAIDNDDPQVEQYQALASDKVRVLVSEPHGYYNLHEYYNAMAEVAQGDWLFLWNDDATMKTQNWLERLQEYDHTEPLVLDLWHGQGNLFPALSRKYYDLIGHYSLSAHCDSWPEDVAVRAGVQHTLEDFYIEHIGEGMQDEVHKKVQEIVRTTSPEFYQPHMIETREREAEIITNHIKESHARNQQLSGVLIA
jgi:hypothetical protein